MTTHNDITGDAIKTKEITDKFRENFDKIFNPPCMRCGKTSPATMHTCTPKEDINEGIYSNI